MIKGEYDTSALYDGRLRWVDGGVGGHREDGSGYLRGAAWHVRYGDGTEWVEKGAAADWDVASCLSVVE